LLIVLDLRQAQQRSAFACAGPENEVVLNEAFGYARSL
jgi:hypothetical protein